MSRPVIAWSYSTLNSFENCPRKLWATKIAKVVSDINKDNVAGDDGHKAFANYIGKGIKLPETLSQYTPYCDKLRAIPGEKYIEMQLTLDSNFVPTQWKNWDAAWVRGAADFLCVDGDKAIYVDHKFGKPNTDEDQIELMSLLVFQHFPQVQQVNGLLSFVAYRKSHPHIVHRRDASLLWNKWLGKVKGLELAVTTDAWPATPNPLCGWCPYTACPNNTMTARLARNKN